MSDSDDHLLGTTSACAENTHYRPGSWSSTGNYLRMRGEYLVEALNALAPMELPPHARRIRVMSDSDDHLLGTTSACAENTPRHNTGTPAIRNYLRVRGEYVR